MRKWVAMTALLVVAYQAGRVRGKWGEEFRYDAERYEAWTK